MLFLSAYKPQLTDIGFELNSWTKHETTDNSISWFTEKIDPAKIQLFDKPSDWPFDLTDEQSAKAFFEQQCKSFSGAMIEMSIKTIGQFDVLQGIFKYRSPTPNSLGIYYVGIVWFPFKNFTFQINFESLEQGTTGIREALVIAQEGIPNNISFESEPLQVDTVEELFSAMRSTELKVIPSDDRKWDDVLPEHPLSKVRAYLDAFMRTVRINPKLLKQKPYRVK